MSETYLDQLQRELDAERRFLNDMEKKGYLDGRHRRHRPALEKAKANNRGRGEQGVG